jgi:hypothetical protein
MTSGDTSTLTIANGDGVSGDPSFTVDAVPSGGGTFTGDLTTEGVLISDLLDLAHTTTRITGYASNEHLIERTASNRFAKLVNNGGTNDDWDLKLFQNGSATPVSVITENQIPLSGMTTGAVLYADSATSLSTKLGPPLLLEEVSISTQANVDLTLPAGWSQFRVEVIELHNAGNDLGAQINVGGGFLSTNYDGTIDQQAQGTSNKVSSLTSNFIYLSESSQAMSSSRGAYYRIDILNPGDGVDGFYCQIYGSFYTTSGTKRMIVNSIGQQMGSATRATEFRLYSPASGNLTSGTVRLYGIA